MTNIEISTSAGVDPKSTYHYVKTILALGIVYVLFGTSRFADTHHVHCTQQEVPRHLQRIQDEPNSPRSIFVGFALLETLHRLR